jgi:hypothetical protein
VERLSEVSTQALYRKGNRMKSAITSLSALVIAVCLSAHSPVAAADPTPATAASDATSPRSGEQIKWQVVSVGGNFGTSTSFRLDGTIGQPAVGVGTSPSFSLVQGYWQAPVTPYLCGDADASGIVTISDVVFLINYIFGGGPAPNPLAAGDADCTGIITISDAVYLINYIFGGGPSPCAACP